MNVDLIKLLKYIMRNPRINKTYILNQIDGMIAHLRKMKLKREGVRLSFENYELQAIVSMMI